jgi:adenylate kinase
VKLIVFLGAPGSGKGTQAQLLSKSDGYIHLSTGNLLRVSIRENTPLGIKAQSFMDRGELVPDSLMIELLESELSLYPADSKILLDGFPRTVKQAESLDENPKTVVNKAVLFEVPERVLLTRLTGRRICEKCGSSFHIINLRPKKEGVCDYCSGRLIQRADDEEMVVKKRLEVFFNQNKGLTDFYSKKNKLSKVRADVEVEKVQSDLLSLLPK